MKQLPKRFKKFKKDFPNVAKAYEELGTTVHKSGPLNKKTRVLVKLAISTGA
jgi:4-carboxymuconolactone decarboxylase